jgi:hypothetical protein
MTGLHIPEFKSETAQTIVYLVCELVAIPAIQKQLHYGYGEKLDERHHAEPHVIHLEPFPRIKTIFCQLQMSVKFAAL